MATKKQIDYAWDNARPIRRSNPDTWRKDSEDNKIRRGSYGTQGKYGWEVDHKNPKNKGGSDSLRNIQALYWEENREKSDKRR